MPVEHTMAVLRAHDVHAFILGFIRPGLNSSAVLLVVLPLPFVHGSIQVDVLAVSIGFVIFPLAHVDVTIGVDEASQTAGLSIEPLALVERAIDPELPAFAESLLVALVPLAEVDCSAQQEIGTLRVETCPTFHF